jgi:lipoyl(octanoyl) transferase
VSNPDSSLSWRWLGQVPYRTALERQRAHRQAVLAGRAQSELWLLEHPPVVTEGRRPPPIPTPVVLLAEHGIDWVRTERGGLATYHGPGQLVGYLIADIGPLRLSVRATVAALEQGLIDWLAGSGVQAGRRPEYPGVWVGQAKIGAVGLHFQRNVSMHGFALNLTTPLEPFGLFVPCGIHDGSVTTLAQLLGASAPGPAEAAPAVAAAVLSALATPRLAPPPSSP